MKLTQLLILALITIALSPIQTGSGLLGQLSFDERDRHIQGRESAGDRDRTEYQNSINDKIDEITRMIPPQDPTGGLLEEDRFERVNSMETQRESLRRGTAWSFGSILSLFTA